MTIRILINFKCYPEGTGDNAVSLAQLCERVSRDTGVSIGIVVQAVDIFRVCSAVSLPVYCQHLDGVAPGAFTGSLCALSVSRAGAAGVLLNHSEKHMEVDAIEDALREAKYHGLDVVVCASDADIGAAVATLLPDIVAVEPPELIGGDISVSSAQPSLIQESVSLIHGVNKDVLVFVGAGIHIADDVRSALAFGASGILVSSGVVLADDSEKVLRELCSGFL